MIRWGGHCMARTVLSGLLALHLACFARLAPPEAGIEEMDELSDELAGEGLDTMRGYAPRSGLAMLLTYDAVAAAWLLLQSDAAYFSALLFGLGETQPC